MLREETFFGIRDKVLMSIDRLREFEPPEGYCNEDSGGKDSTVVDHLLKMAGVKYDSHFCVTGVDPPELTQYLRHVRPYVVFERPKKNMWQLIREQNLPTRINRFCCRELKEWHGTGRLVVTGLRWQESIKRRKRKMVETCYRDSTKRFLHPIIDWSTTDVWEYIGQEGLEYCKLYDEKDDMKTCKFYLGNTKRIEKRIDCLECINFERCKLWIFKRIGCVGCPIQTQKSRKREFERYPNFLKAYLHAMEKNMNNRDMSIFANVQQWFDWWMSDKPLLKEETDLFSHFE